MSDSDSVTGPATDAPAEVTFRDLGLPETLLKSLDAVGYETPTPIQAETIPHLLEGEDLLGHAPTGTGKTAAFALPLLARINPRDHNVQVMVLAPTRELAIQVAEAFQRYAHGMDGFHVLPIYGGSDYGGQIRQLKRGVQVVVGTPGRVMDHMRRGTLNLNGLQALVLDEADEMLRMGFIDDVEWILSETPKDRQIALFSATMPKEIQHIAREHLNQPHEISIKARTATAETIRQRWWMVAGMENKLDALTRILEVEPTDGVIIFVRTKLTTVEVAERLEARGYAAAALNGDLPQAQREQMVERLKNGRLDILVATDVAARGLDVERMSHVINFDIPYDTEAYIHRIGRTGRAGRSGEAILFVAPREKRMLYTIERATRQRIEKLVMPTTEAVNNTRIAAFKQRISDTIAAGELEFMHGLLEQYQQEHDVPALNIAAALAKLSLGGEKLLLELERPRRKADGERRKPRERDPGRGDFRDDRRGQRQDRDHRGGYNDDERRSARRPKRPQGPPDEGMERFRIAVGHDHQVKPGNIVGAIANEAGLDAQHIGRIDIQGDHSTVDLPAGMPPEVMADLRKAWVCGQRLNIRRDGEDDRDAGGDRPPRKKFGGHAKHRDDGPTRKPHKHKQRKDKDKGKPKRFKKAGKPDAG